MPQPPLIPSQTEVQPVPGSPDETATTPPSPPGPDLGTPVVPGEVGVLGPYRLLKELGRGGMGAVYAALDTRLDRRLALKVMLPQFAADLAAKERFLREARAAARVKHDNVVTVYEADDRSGVPYIAMEFLEGCPLDRYLKTKGPPALPQALRIVAEAAAGLAAAHKLGLVHRDVKPGNLWLEVPNGRVKVLDFGLARTVDAEVELTKRGVVVGTPAYMSPEQARGERVDHRTDLFSLGAVLYRLCTGKLPFNGPNTMAVLMALGMEEPPAVRERNPNIPESLAVLIHQLLSKRADDRPPTADEVVKRLRAIARELATPPAALSASQTQLVQPPVGVVPIPVAVSTDANPFADIDADADATERETVAAPAAPNTGRAKSGGKTPWMFAGLAALVAAVAVAGVIIVIKNRDGTETKIEVPDGATVTVKDKGGKTLAQVGPEEVKPAVVGADPDRAAAEFALSLGGTVCVNGQNRELKAVADLPKERLTLTRVGLDGTKVTDAGLALFKGCKGLTFLDLAGTAVTDAGLANFAGGTGLKELVLNKTAVTDAGLAHLKDCKGLTYLDLAGTAVTDAGLAHFKDCKGVTFLALGGTRVTDAGLAHFKDCKGLTMLQLWSTGVTDAGLAHFKECKGLMQLVLSSTAVTDAGLAHFKDCKGLTVLNLHNCKLVTDAGLAHFKDCTALTHLHLGGKKVTDAGLALFKDCKGLTFLDLAGTAVTDAGLAPFRDCKGLTYLILWNTGVTDAGLKGLAGLTNLTTLGLQGTKVTEAGVKELQAALPNCKIEK